MQVSARPIGMRSIGILQHFAIGFQLDLQEILAKAIQPGNGLSCKSYARVRITTIFVTLDASEC